MSVQLNVKTDTGAAVSKTNDVSGLVSQINKKVREGNQSSEDKTQKTSLKDKVTLSQEAREAASTRQKESVQEQLKEQQANVIENNRSQAAGSGTDQE